MSIFVLHGASSADKTTIGKALQTAIGEQCVYTSIDALWPSLPADSDQALRVYAHTASDLVVDSGVLSPEACAELIVAATRVPPRALREFMK